MYATLLLVENTYYESERSKLYQYTTIIVVHRRVWVRNLRRDEEDDQANIFNSIQKRPNVGCRDKTSETQNKTRYAVTLDVLYILTRSLGVHDMEISGYNQVLIRAAR